MPRTAAPMTNRGKALVAASARDASELVGAEGVVLPVGAAAAAFTDSLHALRVGAADVVARRGNVPCGGV
jgi:hypothetical protein